MNKTNATMNQTNDGSTQGPVHYALQVFSESVKQFGWGVLLWMWTLIVEFPLTLMGLLILFILVKMFKNWLVKTRRLTESKTWKSGVKWWDSSVVVWKKIWRAATETCPEAMSELCNGSSFRFDLWWRCSVVLAYHMVGWCVCFIPAMFLFAFAVVFACILEPTAKPDDPSADPVSPGPAASPAKKLSTEFRRARNAFVDDTPTKNTPIKSKYKRAPSPSADPDADSEVLESPRDSKSPKRKADSDDAAGAESPHARKIRKLEAAMTKIAMEITMLKGASDDMETSDEGL